MTSTFLNPTIDDFKLYFNRDFPYGTDISTSILDSDIAKAFNKTNFWINEGLFDKQENYTMGYMELAAHWLVEAIRASSQGVAGRYNWIEASKGVSGVNSSFSIPQKILDNPILAMLSQTRYGAAYLELIMPQLVGNTATVLGRTHP